jgi:hypothetical protein
MTDCTQPPTENLSGLIVSQVNFGLAYVQEARTAYGQGRFEYADLARQIALNAYSTVTRFAARLPKTHDPAILSQVSHFKAQVDALLREPMAVPSIA